MKFTQHVYLHSESLKHDRVERIVPSALLRFESFIVSILWSDFTCRLKDLAEYAKSGFESVTLGERHSLHPDKKVKQDRLLGQLTFNCGGTIYHCERVDSLASLF